MNTEFSDSFFANCFANLPVMIGSGRIAGLAGKFKGVPAFLVAGGPSLNKNIHLLSLVKSRGLMFGVDTVLPALVSHGIYPDFLGTIDPQPLAWEKVADCASRVKDKKISLICLDCVTPQVPKRFPAEDIFWVFSGKKPSSWFHHFLGGRSMTSGVESAAHLNLLSAVIMGCSPIVFVGHDFAFSEGRSHVDNVVFTNREEMEKMISTEADITCVKGTDGGTVKTSRGFASMKNAFEKVVRNHPGTYINATEGGAHIEGTAVLSFKETLQRYCPNPCHGTVQERIASLPEIDSKKSVKAAIAEFNKTMESIKGLKTLILRTERLIHDCRKKINKKSGYNYTSFDELPVPLKKKIKQIDQCQAEQDKSVTIWQLLDEFTMEGFRENERRKHTLAAIENKPEYYKKWLSQTLDRFSFVNGVRIKALQKLYDPLEYFVTYMQQEERLEPDSMGLARLFLDDSNYAMAAPLLKTIEESGLQSAELKFFLGVVAASCARSAEADAYFTEAVGLDPLISKRISRFENDLGNQYSAYVATSEMDKKVVLHMLLKGFRSCRDHRPIKKKLEEIATSDLQQFNEEFDYNPGDMVKPSIDLWFETIKENANGLSFLNPSQKSLFCYYFARFASHEDKWGRAKDALERALSFDSANPEIHALLAEVLFELQEFENGVDSVNSAVSLDARYGKIWDSLGDKMLLKKQYGDALAAYEQLLHLNLESADSLKKIGDCYLALNQPEAARDIYYQVKLLLDKKSKA